MQGAAKLVELVGIGPSTSLEKTQVIEFASIAQCPECLEILHRALPNLWNALSGTAAACSLSAPKVTNNVLSIVREGLGTRVTLSRVRLSTR